MGQHNQFESGWQVPNNGVYVEIGEHPDSGNLHHPKEIRLKRGDKFPETSDPNRKWTRAKENSN